jgi:hypothetical protein
MGLTTLGLPYPEDDDTPDIPRDIKALAEEVDSQIGEAKTLWNQKSAQIHGAIWTGQLTFAAGWADVPDISLPTSASVGAPGVTWKVTANVQETNDGKAWYVTVRSHDQESAKLRVNCSDRTFAGAKTVTVVWNAVCR